MVYGVPFPMSVEAQGEDFVIPMGKTKTEIGEGNSFFFVFLYFCEGLLSFSCFLVRGNAVGDERVGDGAAVWHGVPQFG